MIHRLTIETQKHPRWPYRWACSCGRASGCWSATEGIAAGAHRKHVSAAMKLGPGPGIEEHW